VAVTPNGLYVYVTSFLSTASYLSVISTATNTNTANVVMGANPYGVAVTPNTGLAVTGLSASSGSTGGGTAVSVYGSGFVAGSTTVKFGATAATSVSCSATTICSACRRRVVGHGGCDGDGRGSHVGDVGGRSVHVWGYSDGYCGGADCWFGGWGDVGDGDWDGVHGGQRGDFLFGDDGLCGGG